MSWLGDLIAILNTGRDEYKERHTGGDSAFAIHISPPREAEFDLQQIKFVISTEINKDDYDNQTEAFEETKATIVRNVTYSDTELKGKAYLFTISNKNRMDFSIHNIQFADLSTYVDVARERWFHNEEREIQFLVTPELKISKIEIDYDSITETYKVDPGHNRMVCTEKKEIRGKRTHRKL